mmetsp:Transcript_41926/g.110484  ORF Transcript_41926/g.110484 Transcript_41926/m.110484 type:complete len:97 (-) Transcript_41926:366-656(-)
MSDDFSVTFPRLLSRLLLPALFGKPSPCLAYLSRCASVGVAWRGGIGDALGRPRGLGREGDTSDDWHQALHKWVGPRPAMIVNGLPHASSSFRVTL